MAEEEKDQKNTEKAQEESPETVAPVDAICGNSEQLAAELVNDDSEIEPTSGFFFTSQRWH
jgi:hypothetical protein